MQLTVPKAIADQYGIGPGDELQWIAAGEGIRVIPAGKNNLGSDWSSSIKLRSDKGVDRRKRAKQSAGPQRVAGRERSYMVAASLIEGSFPEKQAIATKLLRRRLED